MNLDHHEVYFANTPSWQGKVLRRHGDQMQRLKAGYFSAQGRADDTMNLGGIKVSSAEIERVANRVDGISETAAIAVSPDGGGPAALVLVVVPSSSAADKKAKILADTQKAIKQRWKCALTSRIWYGGFWRRSSFIRKRRWPIIYVPA